MNKPTLPGFLFSLLMLSTSASATQYNVWYESNGVRTGMTQTPDEQPVMISIAFPGHAQSNIMISYSANEKCTNSANTFSLPVDHTTFEVDYRCTLIDEKSSVQHFTITDAKAVAYLYGRLQAGFTVVLQRSIKVYVANFTYPKQGSSPDL